MDTWAYILAAVLLIVIVLAIVIYYIITSRKKEVEAVEVERPQTGAREIIPFDEDMEAALYKKKVVCPECKEDVDPYDEVCPYCQVRLKFGEFECSNCGSLVDPRDKECPQCGEILFPDPFVCPNCQAAVEADSTKCDSCGARFWSPIRLDERSLKSRLRKLEDVGSEPEPEKEERPSRRRAYR